MLERNPRQFGEFEQITLQIQIAEHTHLSILYQEELLGESIFINDQRYRQISDGHNDVVFDLFMETCFCN